MCTDVLVEGGRTREDNVQPSYLGLFSLIVLCGNNISLDSKSINILIFSIDIEWTCYVKNKEIEVRHTLGLDFEQAIGLVVEQPVADGLDR